MANNQRILVMAHGHPDFSLGGGELAAYTLFKAYQARDDVDEAWYLGRADRGRGATGNISLRRPNEYLWEQAVNDWHLINPRYPFGGYKQSGHARDKCFESVKSYTQSKSAWFRLGSSR